VAISGLVEAISQVTGVAGRPRSPKRARRVSGFGMINYDRGVCSSAAILRGWRMTDKLLPPKKKDPQLRQRCRHCRRAPLAPALGLTSAAAARGVSLQHCEECGAVQYPPRDACCACLSTDLDWRETAGRER
jgi:hypothetical protein